MAVRTGLVALPKKIGEKIHVNEYADFNNLPSVKGRSRILP